ncbi:MAG: hypothetical protein USCAAHI_02280 [Beijerinckiaceae bacterium]|nr:MAG: hypothetical protein USCAAHI_02280 [Beijerinckiaceae bacterium]
MAAKEILVKKYVSREFLLAQEDCHVFQPSNSFKDARAGVHWQNLLLDEYGTGYWTLVVDADELLVYPDCEKIKLPEFCKVLESEGRTSFFAFLLDMYPGKDFSQATCEPGKPFHEICPYFDKDYVFRKLGANNREVDELPPVRVIGGPRVRKFYPWQKRTDFFSKALA